MAEAARRERPWKKWGPYLSERQWGTVRENATRGIEAWNEVSHDQARSRAYLSGEDGLCGFCDDQMLLCFALALWNGRDPILKVANRELSTQCGADVDRNETARGDLRHDVVTTSSSLWNFDQPGR